VIWRYWERLLRMSALCVKSENMTSNTTSKWCEVGYKLVLLTNRKWHTEFRLLPKSLFLNDLERCNYCRCALSAAARLLVKYCWVTGLDILLLQYALAYGWLRSTVGRTPVSGRQTDPVLHSACSRRVTTMWVNPPLQASQLGQLSLSSFRGR